MAEGELAKRFRRWIYYSGRLAPKNNSEVMGGLTVLVEEAKKEFPEDYKALGWPKIPFDEPYLNRIAKWFTKWFGEVEEDG